MEPYLTKKRYIYAASSSPPQMPQMMNHGLISAVLLWCLVSLGGAVSGYEVPQHGVPQHGLPQHGVSQYEVPQPQDTQGCLASCECSDLTMTCSHLPPTPWMELLQSLPPGLQQLSLLQSNLSGLTSPPALPLTHLTQLHITHSLLHYLGPQTLSCLPSLEQLFLTHDGMREVHVEAFSHLPALQLLNLSHNAITDLPTHMFQHNPRLQILDLSHNRLKMLYPRVFPFTPGLEMVNLSHNAISYLHPGALTNLSQVTALDLSSNQLETLHNETFTGLPALATVRLHGNPWVCDCGLLWLHHAASNMNQPILRALVTEMECHAPAALHQLPLGGVLQTDLTCSQPHIITNHSTDIKLKRYDSVIIHCNATGYPPPSVYWITPRGVLALPKHRKWMSPGILHFKQSHNYTGMPSYLTSHLRVLPDDSLEIHQVRHYFAGSYSCIAENPAGISVSSFNLTLVSGLSPEVHFSMFIGACTACGFIVFALLFSLIREARYMKIKYDYKKQLEVLREQGIEVGAGHSVKQVYGGWVPPVWMRDDVFSPYESPLKCTTPVEGGLGQDYDMVLYDQPPPISIRETLEHVRLRLRDGVTRGVTKIRSGARHVTTSSRLYMTSIRENSTNYMQNIKETGSQKMNTLRSSSSTAANRVRAGVVMGAEQIKHHVQSMRELCLPGNLGTTVSTVSVATNVDSQETYDIVRKTTWV